MTGFNLLSKKVSNIFPKMFFFWWTISPRNIPYPQYMNKPAHSQIDNIQSLVVLKNLQEQERVSLSFQGLSKSLYNQTLESMYNRQTRGSFHSRSDSVLLFTCRYKKVIGFTWNWTPLSCQGTWLANKVIAFAYQITNNYPSAVLSMPAVRIESDWGTFYQSVILLVILLLILLSYDHCC